MRDLQSCGPTHALSSYHGLAVLTLFLSFFFFSLVFRMFAVIFLNLQIVICDLHCTVSKQTLEKEKKKKTTLLRRAVFRWIIVSLFFFLMSRRRLKRTFHHELHLDHGGVAGSRFVWVHVGSCCTGCLLIYHPETPPRQSAISVWLSCHLIPDLKVPCARVSSAICKTWPIISRTVDAGFCLVFFPPFLSSETMSGCAV